MEGINIESQSLLINKLDTEGLCKKFLFEKDIKWEQILNGKSISDMKEDKKYQKKLYESFENILKHKDYLYKINKTLENNILYPIDINRLCKNKCLQKDKILSNVSPLYILKQNEELKEKLNLTESFKNNKIIQILIDI